MDYCRKHKKSHQAYLIGKYALTLSEPLGALFEAHWIYDYGLLEEFSIAAFHSGRYQDCIQAIEKLLAEGKIPEAARTHLKEEILVFPTKLNASMSAPA